ncbi:hypothetical protein Tco_0858634 [Tanacetum coccineum]|uniref:DUF4283 domain-containing protein n=1 Tax=Tanacetum coccineum TaxID=301880 RepID=A0ABQ5BD02_9ASTR
MHWLTILEQKNHADIIEELVQANVLNKVKNQLPKFLLKAVSEYVQPRLERTVRDVLKKNPINMLQSSSTPTYTFIEYELKQKLYNMMQNSRSFLELEKHLALYNALINLIGIDESAAKGDTSSQHKRYHDGQDPPEDREGEKRRKKRRKVIGESSSKKSKAQEDHVHYERGNDADEPRQEDEIIHEAQTEETLGKDNPQWFQNTAAELSVQNWFNELVDAQEEPDEFEYKDGSMTLFGKHVKKIFKKDKITKEDMEGPAFELLKGTCKNNIEIEYNMDQCYLALRDKIDWINPEGDMFHHDLSKPLPLTGPPGRKRIPVSYFFNHDLEYLKYGTKENTYALLVTKNKAARYEDEEIEEMISSLWSLSIQKYNKDAELGIYHWYPKRQWFYKGSTRFKYRHEVYSKLNIKSVQSIKVNKQYGYAYLEEIMVTRADEKDYKFAEADFPNLNQNDIEDLYLLKIQNKICNIKGAEEYDLINALKMYIRRIVIKKRVKDVQMGVESYQTKLNLTKPQLMEGCLHQKMLYTILSHPRDVVYEGVDNRKRLMRADELYKFCDGMEKCKWTDKEKRRILKFMDKIEKTLKERKRFRRLELFVGGRRDKTDYCLLGLEDLLKNGPYMIWNVPATLKKWSPDANVTKEDLTRVPVWVKLHYVLMVAFSSDILSMIATKFGKHFFLFCQRLSSRVGQGALLRARGLKFESPYGFLLSMCMESCVHGSFARALIELDATCGLKDRCNDCKIFGNSCDNCPQQASTSKAQPKDEKLQDVHDDGLQSVIQKTSKRGNCKSQGKRQGSRFAKPTNDSYKPIVKPKSSSLVSNPFSALKEDNGNSIDDLVDDTRKKVVAPPGKTGIWSARKADRNIAFSPKTELHYFVADVLEFANMDQGGGGRGAWESQMRVEVIRILAGQIVRFAAMAASPFSLAADSWLRLVVKGYNCKLAALSDAADYFVATVDAGVGGHGADLHVVEKVVPLAPITNNNHLSFSVFTNLLTCYVTTKICIVCNVFVCCCSNTRRADVELPLELPDNVATYMTA